MSHQFLPFDYIADFRRLGAPVGCDLAVLKRCYRVAAGALHPDRRAGEASAPGDDSEFKEISSAYRRLLAFHREHGHLPGRPRAVIREPRSAAPDSTTVAPMRGASAAWILVASLGAIAAIWAIQAVDVPLELPHERAVAEPAKISPTPLPRSTGSAATRTIHVGFTKAEVRSIVGAPLLASDEIWEYGPSHIRFERGRVVDWYSSPLKPLPVAESAAGTPRQQFGD
jgi:hypothetical protein